MNAEQMVAAGQCTGCEAETGELVPWAGERLCWNCTDLQLDLMALACQSADGLPVTVGQGVRTPGHIQELALSAHDGEASREDRLANAIAALAVTYSDGDSGQIKLAEKLFLTVADLGSYLDGEEPEPTEPDGAQYLAEVFAESAEDYRRYA